MKMSENEGLDLVLFGGTGDLVMRKLLPALYYLQRDGLLAADMRIIGIARPAMTRADYTAVARQQCMAHLGGDFDAARWERFVAHLDYRGCDAIDPGSYAELAALLEAAPQRQRVFYLSTAPSLFTAICHHLSGAGLVRPDSRVVLEKPLGHDLEIGRAHV